MAQLNTVANMRRRGQNVSTTNNFPGMKNVSTFGRNEYVGKRGMADGAGKNVPGLNKKLT